MSIRTTFAGRAPYAAWLVLSAILLAIARATDPYVLGFSAFGAAGISGVMVVVAACFGLRSFLWALAASLPTVAAFAILSTYKWA